jgi:hypothetical protein
MKLSPILLFLIILFTLAFSILFGNWFYNEYATIPSYTTPSNTLEGMLDFKRDVFFHGNTIIPYYSTKKPLHKLHDSIYYDNLNGTVVVIDGSLNSASPDLIGNTISKIWLYSRNSAKTEPVMDTLGNTISTKFEHDLSKSTTLIDSYTNFEITASTTNPSGASDKYQLLYVPWGRETYLHLIVLNDSTSTTDKTGTTPVLKYTFAYDDAGRIIQAVNPSTGGQSTTGNLVVYETPTILANAFANSTTNLYQSADSQFLKLNYYDTTNLKYQLCYRTLYNPLNGEIIVTSEANSTNPTSVTLYNRITDEKRNDPGKVYTKEATTNRYILNGAEIPSPSGNIAVPTNGGGLSGFASRLIKPGTGGPDDYYSVIYTSVGKRTLLVIIKINNAVTATNVDTKYTIYKIYRFDDKGVLIDGKFSFGNSGSGSVDSGAKTPPPPQYGTDSLNDWLFKYLLSSGNSNFNYSTINDYMLKTQIVPPVCPTCPACPSLGDGACIKCGGNGGSGTSTDNKTADKKTDKDKSSDKGESNEKRYDQDGNVLKDAGRGASNLLRDTGSGATNLLRDTGSGTTSLLRDTASGTVGLAKDTVSGTVGLAKDTVSGGIGLVKDTAGGVINTFGKIVPTKVRSTKYDGDDTAEDGSSQPAGATTGSDYLSYFGALPSKGGNYIPVTADFSKFGR